MSAVATLATLHLLSKLAAGPQVVDDSLIRKMEISLGPLGCVIRETSEGWTVYHKAAATSLFLSPDGDLVDKKSKFVASVFARGAFYVIKTYFEKYLPEPEEGATLQYVRGNLLTSDCDIIAHGCNCFHAMGGGIASYIARAFPRAEDADFDTEEGDPGKLGTYSYSRGTPDIFNLYTQFEPGANIDYGAVRDAFKALYRHCKSHGLLDKKIGIPKIGAGIAGGDWSKVASIIESVWEEGQIYVYVL